jgi:hypothetical protein
MTTRARPAGRFRRAWAALVVLAVLTTVLFVAGNAVASGPAPEEVLGVQHGAVVCSSAVSDTSRIVGLEIAAAAKPAVNWKWLIIGVGGVVVLLALMWLLQRGFQRRAPK